MRRIRAQKYINDKQLRGYFIEKAKELLETNYLLAPRLGPARLAPAPSGAAMKAGRRLADTSSVIPMGTGGAQKKIKFLRTGHADGGMHDVTVHAGFTSAADVYERSEPNAFPLPGALGE
jgi:hypothetical protein